MSDQPVTAAWSSMLSSCLSTGRHPVSFTYWSVSGLARRPRAAFDVPNLAKSCCASNRLNPFAPPGQVSVAELGCVVLPIANWTYFVGSRGAEKTK
jgi:hypothetical protein